MIVIALALLAGCSTTESRSKDKQVSFDRLTPRQKSDVLDGKVAVGMNTDAVFIAFGPPERVAKEGKSERWTYTKAEFYDVPHWRDRCVQRAGGGISTIPEYDPLQMKREVDSLEVIFKNGKVTTWKKLNP
jgi:outer membrane protein assembly factor BamE (lipoprotein component of BamABCDE complex)